MAWRRSDDPRCPECGEKLAATASFCMHCEVDLPDGPIGGTTETVGGDSLAGDDYDSDPTPTDDYDPTGTTTPSESADYGGLDDDDDGIEKTTLLLRGPIALVMAFPAALLALFGVVGAFDSMPAVGALVVLVGSYVAVAVYLGRKPLASDEIGDGLYLYGALFVTIPLLWMVGDLVQLALGTTDSLIVDIVVFTIVMELAFLFPAAICFVLGYLANTYARRKLEAALDGRTPA